MKIHNECSFIKPDGIVKVENMYNATFVMEHCIKLSGGEWANWPSAIFHTEKAHPEGSNYFALYKDPYDNRLMITNGISAIEPFNALQVGDDVIYSRYRHDCQSFKGALVDGGRDYFKHNGVGQTIILRVNKDKLEVADGIPD